MVDSVRGETRALIGKGGGAYSHIHVLPDELCAEGKNINIHRSPPIKTLVLPLDLMKRSFTVPLYDGVQL